MSIFFIHQIIIYIKKIFTVKTQLFFFRLEMIQCSMYIRGESRGGGGAHPVRAPLKIGKNMIFWHKIVIFHTKYHKNFRASLHSAQFF